MKTLLFATLESNAATEALLGKLSGDGYNGTYIPTSSLKHLLSAPHTEEAGLLLCDLADGTYEGNITLYIVEDEKKIAKIQAEIRKYSENFTKIKGDMFTFPLSTFEGSFSK